MLKVNQTPPASEELLQSALAKYFDWYGKWCFPSVCMWRWEQDFVVVTDSMKVWEVEIKVSREDWRADQHKSKWKDPNWQKVSRFYYCVPVQLIADGIPPWVPEYAGVITATKAKDGWRLRTAREAKNRSTFKLSDKWLNKLLSSTYHRFWRTRKFDPMHGMFVKCEEPSDQPEVVH